jgi:hypothetical protein
MQAMLFSVKHIRLFHALFVADIFVRGPAAFRRHSRGYSHFGEDDAVQKNPYGQDDNESNIRVHSVLTN